MTTLIAQLTPANLPSFVQFVIGGSATIFLLNQALRFYKDHIKEQPTPSNTYATKEELRQTHGRIAREREELNREIARVGEEQKAIRLVLDSEIKDLNRRIDAVPGRVIALLRETKGLI